MEAPAVTQLTVQFFDHYLVVAVIFLAIITLMYLSPADIPSEMLGFFGVIAVLKVLQNSINIWSGEDLIWPVFEPHFISNASEGSVFITGVNSLSLFLMKGVMIALPLLLLYLCSSEESWTDKVNVVIAACLTLANYNLNTSYLRSVYEGGVVDTAVVAIYFTLCIAALAIKKKKH